jgi:hypothetical protein
MEDVLVATGRISGAGVAGPGGGLPRGGLGPDQTAAMRAMLGHIDERVINYDLIEQVRGDHPTPQPLR